LLSDSWELSEKLGKLVESEHIISKNPPLAPNWNELLANELVELEEQDETEEFGRYPDLTLLELLLEPNKFEDE